MLLRRNSYSTPRVELQYSILFHSIIVSDLYVLRILVVASTKIATIDEYICVGSVVGSIEAVMIQQNT